MRSIAAMPSSRRADLHRRLLVAPSDLPVRDCTLQSPPQPCSAAPPTQRPAHRCRRRRLRRELAVVRPFIDRNGRLASITRVRSRTHAPAGRQRRRHGGASPITGRAAGCLRRCRSFPGAADCSYGDGGRLQAASVPRLPDRHAVVGGVRVVRDGCARDVPGFRALRQPYRFRPRCLSAPGNLAAPLRRSGRDHARRQATCCASRAGATRLGLRGDARLPRPAVPATA